tara:strand:- start:25 stop:243 length:219 start_codon:yes stop_codon:yes gene_type:complete
MGKMKAWLMEQEERGVYTSDEARDIWFLRNYGVDVSGIRVAATNANIVSCLNEIEAARPMEDMLDDVLGKEW